MADRTASRQSRASLIEAGLHLFGRHGFSGTSTRALAQRAGTNVASIAYHFGGKEGLREACARTVAERVIGAIGSTSPDPPRSPAEAAEEIERAVRALVRLIVAAPEAQDMVAFMLREVTDRGPVADLIYAEFVEERHRQFSSLWAMATGRNAEDEEVKLAVFAMIGQVLYFRIALPFVERRMGWSALDPNAAGRIADVVAANVRASIERQRR
jgi:TetR/AcrR family transcriptional regulator, regulator of cefoperazone and chloramphenicol sensitivity